MTGAALICGLVGGLVFGIITAIGVDFYHGIRSPGYTHRFTYQLLAPIAGSAAVGVLLSATKWQANQSQLFMFSVILFCVSMIVSIIHATSVSLHKRNQEIYIAPGNEMASILWLMASVTLLLSILPFMLGGIPKLPLIAGGDPQNTNTASIFSELGAYWAALVGFFGLILATTMTIGFQQERSEIDRHRTIIATCKGIKNRLDAIGTRGDDANESLSNFITNTEQAIISMNCGFDPLTIKLAELASLQNDSELLATEAKKGDFDSKRKALHSEITNVIKFSNDALSKLGVATAQIEY